MPSPALRAMMGTKDPKFGLLRDRVRFARHGADPQRPPAASTRCSTWSIPASATTQLKRDAALLSGWHELPVIVSTVGRRLRHGGARAARHGGGRHPAGEGRQTRRRPEPSSITPAMRPRARAAWRSASPHDRYRQRPAAPALRASEPGRGVSSPRSRPLKASRTSRRLPPLDGCGRHLDRPFRPLGRHGQSRRSSTIRNFRRRFRARGCKACKRHGKSLGRIYDDTETGRRRSTRLGLRLPMLFGR